MSEETIKLEEQARTSRAMLKIQQVLEEENCKAEAVITLFGSSRIGSEVQIVALPLPVEEPVAEPTQPVAEGGNA